MDWFFEGLTAAFWQIAVFLGMLVLAAAGVWSCNYLGINPGYGILGFYASLIVGLNLLFAWQSRNKFNPLTAETSNVD